MTDCYFCEILKGKVKAHKIYEDENTVVIAHPEPAVPGHLLIFPKTHHTIFELMPDSEAEHLFNLANKMSMAVFEALHAKGTNMIVQNGAAAGQEIPHFAMHIIPRNENDGLELLWEPRQLNEEEMSTVELKLKEGCKNIGKIPVPEKKAEAKKTEAKEEKKEPGKAEKKRENYLIKQLERMP
jgi:histidine triad (HIT) family protein